MIPFTRVLCPVDFSERSPHQLGYAVAVARRYGCAIAGLHVYPTTLWMGVSGYPSTAIPQPDVDVLRRELRDLMTSAGASGLSVDALVEGGEPARVIVEQADAQPGTLVVMGTHGSGGVERFALGSVAEKVLRRAGSPVLTVPPLAPPVPDPLFARIACAVDFSRSSLAAVNLALSLATEPGARLTLVHVLEVWLDDPAVVAQPFTVYEYGRQRDADARRRLAELVPPEMVATVDAQVRHGKPYAQVLAAADEARAELIVVGIHARNALDLALLGSTTNQIVRRAACPVLTARFA